MERSLNKLLIEELDEKKYKETSTLHKSLRLNRQGLLTFLYYKEVPSHNNGSEQAIRNAKVKMKVSGQFKSGQKLLCKNAINNRYTYQE